MTEETTLDQEVFVQPDNPLPDFTFDQLPEHLRKRVEELGWKDPMPVQRKGIPYLRERRDLTVQARTGSGKTGAYLLPILEHVKPKNAWCQALILVPTRELARQVSEVLNQLTKGTDIRYATVYGGVGYGQQIKDLKAGAHVVVGTPGRVIDHIFKGTFAVQKVEFLVLDEADEMLSMGFYPSMRKLRRQLPEKRSTFLFSATIPYHVDQVAHEFLNSHDVLSLSKGNQSVTTLEHRYYMVPPLQKDKMLLRLIEMENPTSSIIFCNTKRNVEYLVEVLNNHSIPAQHITGDLPQKKRERAMDKLRSGELRILVATDVAARGIDISDLSHVILYDIPEHTEVYVHRSGRTARAGNTGIAITLCETIEEKKLLAIAKQYNFPIEKRELPTEEEVSSRIAERLIVTLEDDMNELSIMERDRVKTFLPLVDQLAKDEDSRLLLARLLDRAYLQDLHTAPVQMEVRPEKEAAPKKEQQKKPRRGRRKPRQKKQD
ncbi:MAG: DEAD/DEAH box helicase [Ectothiorhodospiraceae bacterium]|nr:DEAD/DEAH box helicase [Ectothiorhodospiraceae bacterium]